MMRHLNKHLKKGWYLLAVPVALVAVLKFVGRAPVNGVQAPDQGRPWNGGKPTAPMRIEANRDGEIPADEWLDVDLSLIPVEDCRNLSSSLRGLDGLEILDASRWDHPECLAGKPILRAIRVKVPSGVSGLLAVDLSFEGADGKPYALTRSVGFRAQGVGVLGTPQDSENPQ